MYKEGDKVAADGDDVYGHPVVKGYRRVLSWCLQHRLLTMLAMLALLVTSAVGFKQVKQAFFPPSTTPMFYVDLWYPEGTDIRFTSQDARRAEQYLLAQPEVASVATTVGQGAPRFTLTYLVEKSYESYAQLIVRVADKDTMMNVMAETRQYLREHHPQVEDKLIRVNIGPATPAKIEARISGPDPEVLRKLAQQAETILRDDPGAMNIRHDWRQKTKLLRPQFDEAAARRLGITKQDVDHLLKTNFEGRTVGIYRDGTDLLPIISRAPAQERVDLDNWRELQIYSPVLDRYLPLGQVVQDINVVWENA